MKSRVIIVDIDGTLADLKHRLHYVRKPNKEKDYDAFFAAASKDKPKQDVIDIVNLLSKELVVILVTGRPDKYRNETIAWLYKHNVSWDLMYMCKTGDSRLDTIVKKEIFLEKIEPYFDVVAVFDDRQSVVDMWRNELNLTCFQVAQWKEFDVIIDEVYEDIGEKKNE